MHVTLRSGQARVAGELLDRLRRRAPPAPDYHIEVITLPVSDVDLAVRFYAERAGFILDVDYRPKRAIPRCPGHPTRVILFGAVRRRPH